MMNKTVKRLVAYVVLGAVSITNIFFTMSTGVQAAEDVTQFMDCFSPMPIIQDLTSDCWGAPGVLPRDIANGLGEPSNKPNSYWDGGILKDEETGKYHMFASRWPESGGHGEWWNSVAVHAVSDNLYGPYEDLGTMWPDDQGGKGHNVWPLKLAENDPNGKYAIILTETRNGDVYVADDLDGEWTYNGQLSYSASYQRSNVCILLRPDGKYQSFNRNGDIAISDSLMGPYEVKSYNLWQNVDGMPVNAIEDAVIWYSDGLYHCTVNKWNTRIAFYMTSTDGITDWKLHKGTAYSPDAPFLRYTDGTVNYWNKIERPNIYIEDGQVKAMTLSVIDVPKDDDRGNDNHGSKIIVVPFDGEALSKFAHDPSTIIDRGRAAIADTTAQTWNYEADYNYGARNSLRIQSNTSGGGLFGENTVGGTSADCKISYLRFDVSDYDLNNLDSAELSLFFTRPENGVSGMDSIQVALADNTWTEGDGDGRNATGTELSWNSGRPEILYDSENIEGTTATSAEFDTSLEEQEIVINVKHLLENADPDANEITLAICDTKNKHLHLASRELRDSNAPKLKLTDGTGSVSKEELRNCYDQLLNIEASRGDYIESTLPTIEETAAVLASTKNLLKRADATQAEVDAMVAELQEILNAAKKQPDKTALEKAIQRAEQYDLSHYSKETVDEVTLALDTAKEMINSEIGDDQQEIIDGAAENLNTALDGLLFEGGVNIKVNKDTTVQSWGNSEPTYNYGGRNYIRVQRHNDADNPYGLFGERMPENTSDCKIGYLSFDLSEYDLTKIEEASLILTYERSYAGSADDNNVLVTLSDGEWVEGNKDHSLAGAGEITWNSKPALRYDPSNISETTVTSPSFSPAVNDQLMRIDITSLMALMNEGETEISLALSLGTVSDAQLGFYSKEANEKKNAPTLVIKLKEDVEVDKTKLISLYEANKVLEEEAHTEESWSVFKAALDAAEEVINNPDATQEDVDAALSDLEGAIEQLEEKPIDGTMVLIGDVYDDPKDSKSINLKDVLAIQKHVANKDSFADDKIKMFAANVNADKTEDGKDLVDIKDALMLQKWVAKISVGDYIGTMVEYK